MALIAAGFLLAAAFPATASAQSKDECLDAFERGQRSQRELHLVDAAARYTLCARDACPLVVRRDCAERFEQTERDVPTIVVGARDPSGTDLEGVRVLVDGKPLARATRGASQPIDPGTYVFRFERDGFEPSEHRMIVNVGERSRSLIVTMKPLRGPDVAAPASTPSGTAPDGSVIEPTTPAPLKSTSPPIAAYATLGAGAVSLVVGVSFGLTVIVRCGGLFKTPCDTLHEAPLDQIDDREASLDRQAWIANVAVGAGVVLGAVGTYLLVSHHASQRKAMRVFPAMTGQGGGVVFGGAF